MMLAKMTCFVILIVTLLYSVMFAALSPHHPFLQAPLLLSPLSPLSLMLMLMLMGRGPFF